MAVRCSNAASRRCCSGGTGSVNFGIQGRGMACVRTVGCVIIIAFSNVGRAILGSRGLHFEMYLKLNGSCLAHDPTKSSKYEDDTVNQIRNKSVVLDRRKWLAPDSGGVTAFPAPRTIGTPPRNT